jgi:type 1 glutamine amidotransferase
MRIISALLVLTSACLQLRAADLPRIVFIAGEFEYHSKETLPPYARELANVFAVETTVLERPDDPKQQIIAGLEALEQADLVVLLIRRMTLPRDQIDQIRKYVQSGKPLIGLRTASHAFENWKEFDREVLGGNYGNHHGNRLKTTVSIIPQAREHPVLQGVSGFVSDGSLYRNTPLQSGAKPLLLGKVEGFPAEPVAWTHDYKGARVFYTSLGHPNDFKSDSFRALLHNAIEWALDKPLKPREK